MVSCGDDHVVYNEYRSLDDSAWSVEDTLDFTFEATSAEQKYDIFFQIRTTTEYPYSNLFFFMHLQKPDQTIQVDTFQMILAEPNGKWVGNNSGTYVESAFLIADNVQFPEVGEYRFQLVQGMQDDVLNEVSDVGIKIEEAH